MPEDIQLIRKSATTLISECHEDELDLLRRILTTHSLTGRHLEIGTAAGGTLKELIGAYAGIGVSRDFTVIDTFTYFDDQLEKVRYNLSSSRIDPETVTFWTGTTDDFLPPERAAGSLFDFVFIDADHRHYPVTVDLQWADLVRPGGFVCLHDRSEKFPGVGWAIDRFLEKNENYKVFEQAKTLVALQKTGEGRKRSVTMQDLLAAKWAQQRFKLKRSLKKRLGSSQSR
jgi:SAM-dependent methyltransferase